MKLSGIYRIKNIITSDCYVGSAVNIERRWREHKRQLKKNMHTNIHMQRSYNKYGVDAFKYEIFEICPAEFLIEREQERIDSGAFSYNLCKVAGSRAGSKQSDEAKAKIAAAKKGIVFSEETKAKMSAAQKGKKRKPFSEEHKAKMSAAQIGRKASDESKAKMRAAHAARKANLEKVNK
jgi:group I intron endonuclease